jgi:hypothetical protein
MEKFVEATSKEGDKVFINLSLVSVIKETGSGYELSLGEGVFYIYGACNEINLLING